MDMKNYLWTQITQYEEDKEEEASMRCSLLHGSWDQILQRHSSVDKVSGIFLKNYWLNSFHTKHLPLCGESIDLPSFSALWWPNIWPKMGFLELLEKTIGSIRFIPGVYPYWVSLLTPIHFLVPSLILGPLVAEYLVENRVSRTF